MWILLESLTANFAAYCYRRNWSMWGLTRLIDKLSWAAFDHCPKGYKGKA